MGAAAVAAVFIVGLALAGTIGGRPPPTDRPPGASVLPAPGVPTADPQGNYPPIAGIACDARDHVGSRVHAHVELRFGGEIRSIPDGVGTRDSCLYWLTSRQRDGIVHVHPPFDRPSTLGEFFDVWGEVLTDRQVLDRALEPTEGLFVFVNGQRHVGDPRDVELADRDVIELQVGTAPFQPLAYTFPAELE